MLACSLLLFNPITQQRQTASAAMLMKLIDNKFANAATFYVVSVFLVLVSPPLLLFKIIYTILLQFRPTDTNMRGKVVLITGASSGIGECLAYEYAKREAFLVIVARREERLQKVAEKARGIGSPDVLVICGDVSDVNHCRRFIDEAINRFGRLDHLVNNAGIGKIYSVNEEINITKFVPVMDINFWGSIYPTHFAIPHLKKTKGTIIVNASTAGYFNLPKSGFYSASKAAVISFYESLRTELAPEIKITIVTLGIVESEMTLGKQMSEDGEMKHNQEIEDVVLEGFPVMSTVPCAKAIVSGACKGDRCVTEPRFMRPLIAFSFFFPELVQWHCKNFYQDKGIAAKKASQK